MPKPLQKPHPPLFQPFASSERSIRWCAEQNVTAVLPGMLPARERALFELYAETSAPDCWIRRRGGRPIC